MGLEGRPTMLLEVFGVVECEVLVVGVVVDVVTVVAKFIADFVDVAVAC